MLQQPLIKRIEFFPKAVRNDAESERQKKPVWDPKIFVNFIYTDDTNFARPKYDIDEKKYPEQWAAFINSKSAPDKGTPITDLQGITVEEVATLKELSIITVEGLSEAYVSSMKDLGERYVQLRNYATSFLKTREDLEEVFTLRQELAAKDLEILRLKGEPEQIAMAQKIVTPKAITVDEDEESTEDPFGEPEAPAKKKFVVEVPRRK